jgi:hypothetical protein
LDVNIGSHSLIANSILSIEAGPSSKKFKSFGPKSSCSNASPSEYSGLRVGELHV